MKRYFTTCFILFIFSRVFAQNLVPNYSFETNTGCPSFPNQVNLATPWFNPTGGSSDYLHSCATWSDIATPINYWGNQSPRTGLACMGLFACMHFTSSPSFEERREYIEVKLSSTLVAGQKYYACFYVSLGDLENYATDDFGIYFSTKENR
jgi:hypothetical protein